MSKLPFTCLPLGSIFVKSPPRQSATAPFPTTRLLPSAPLYPSAVTVEPAPEIVSACDPTALFVNAPPPLKLDPPSTSIAPLLENAPATARFAPPVNVNDPLFAPSAVSALAPAPPPYSIRPAPDSVSDALLSIDVMAPVAPACATYRNVPPML